MGFFTRLSRVSRARKLDLFNELMRPTPETRVLDVGGEVNPERQDLLRFTDVYPWKDKLTLVNISSELVSRVKQHYPQIDTCVADACSLPYADQSFDIAFSNAVIEHVGDFDRQKKMATEIMRVAKAWFVTTPNRWYPFEFHLRLPLVTWLPFHGYLRASRLISYSHVQQRYVFGHGRSDLRLLSAREFRACFARSRIVPIRVTFWPETLVAVGEASSVCPTTSSVSQ